MYINEIFRSEKWNVRIKYLVDKINRFNIVEGKY